MTLSFKTITKAHFWYQINSKRRTYISCGRDIREIVDNLYWKRKVLKEQYFDAESKPYSNFGFKGLVTV